jgi:pilus assembly protein Flp/PilA
MVQCACRTAPRFACKPLTRTIFYRCLTGAKSVQWNAFGGTLTAKTGQQPKGNAKMKLVSRNPREETGLILSFIQDEPGATAIEYGLIAALISVVIIGDITAVGTQLSTTFNTISTAISGANN